MNVAGLALIVASAWAMRQVVVGRARDIPTDTRDLSLALFKADTKAASEVLSRRGA